MEHLRSLTAKQIVKALKQAGFIEHRQHRTSHLLLVHPERKLRTVVPMHHGDLPRGTVRAIIRQSGMTEEEFKALL
jgi:predicted RNA binding protein YcfA (HicA-like mRNA interferase family)